MVAPLRPAPTLLVIDDEPALLHAFSRIFREPDVRLLTASTAAAGLRLVEEQQPDAVLLDLHLPDSSGMEVLSRIQALDARTPVIVITGQATSQNAIEAMKRGAYDYVVKPQGLDAVRDLVTAAFQVSRAMRVPALSPDGPPAEADDVIIGLSPVMQEVYKAIGRVAPQDVTVLITGESGTGKELVARAIYQNSRRSNERFLAINCAAIPESLLESELFGHEKGSFTGADRQRIGKFEQCNRGTLFLDEVGDMPALTQVKLLRVLQERAFERVGGNELIRTDVRVIAATNRDMEKLVAAGEFRTDLYYRLGVFGVHLPPLRERKEDLHLLVDHFLRRYGPELGKNVTQLGPGVMDLFYSHNWPGNLRELQSVLKQALLRSHGSVLLASSLPPLGAAQDRPAPPAGKSPDLDRIIQERLAAGATNLHAEVTELVERHLLSRVLAHTGGNLLRSARLLGITRGTLRAKLRALGLAAGPQAWSETDQPADEGGREQDTSA
jgi:DNA-binding NtrC family response regulator